MKRPPGIDRRPGGLADVVPTQKVSVPSPRNVDIPRIIVTIKLPRRILQCIHHELFALLQRRIGTYQSRLVSSRLPRFLIAA